MIDKNCDHPSSLLHNSDYYNPPPPHHHHLQVEQHRGISKAKGSSTAKTSGLREHFPLVMGSDR